MSEACCGPGRCSAPAPALFYLVLRDSRGRFCPKLLSGFQQWLYSQTQNVPHHLLVLSDIYPENNLKLEGST